VDYGVHLGRDVSYEQEKANARAFEQAASDANVTDKVVTFSEGVLSMSNIELWSLYNVRFEIDGTILATKNWEDWPTDAGHKNSVNHLHFWQVNDCNNITFAGSGTIDGQGFMWWIREWFVLNKAHRPKLVAFENVSGLEWTGLNVINSPSFFIRPYDCKDVYMHDFEIRADYYGTFEMALLGKFKWLSFLKFPFVTFPLNTDGIDVSGINYTLRRIKITNYDDAIVPKPSNSAHKYPCTQNVLAEDIEVTLGVGMSIGSVPPSVNHACIKDVTFRNVKFNYPFKAIYVKSNPGDAGDAII